MDNFLFSKINQKQKEFNQKMTIKNSQKMLNIINLKTTIEKFKFNYKSN